MQAWLVNIPKVTPTETGLDARHKMILNNDTAADPMPNQQYRPEASLFCSMFPFHLVMGEDLNILQASSFDDLAHIMKCY